MVNTYEVLYILSGQHADTELEPIRNNVRDAIDKIGGKITFEDMLGKKKFAYPVKHEHHGYYIFIHFEIEGAKLDALNKEIRLVDNVLRHLIVKRDPNIASVPFKSASEEKAFMSEKNHDNSRDKGMRSKPSTSSKKPEDDKDKTKINIADLDKKLDEILDTDKLV